MSRWIVLLALGGGAAWAALVYISPTLVFVAIVLLAMACAWSVQ